MSTDRARRLQARQARIARRAAAMSVTYKSLSKWSIQGLDISDAGFAKLHDKELKFEDDEKQYDLDPAKFKRYVDNLKEKVNRTILHVLKHYSTITEAQMTARKNTR